MMILTLLIVLLITCYIYLKYLFSYWKIRGVETIQPSIPFGNIRDVLFVNRQYNEVFTEIYNRIKGPYAGIYFLTSPALIIKDPEYVRAILVKDFAHFQDRGVHSNEKVEPLTGHLFRLSGQKWRNLRAKLSPAFTSGKLKAMFHTVIQCSAELENLLDRTIPNSECLSVSNFAARYTTDVIASVGFGIDCNTLQNPNADFAQYTQDVRSVSLWKGIKNMCILFLPHFMRYTTMRQQSLESEQFFMKVVEDTVNYREKNQVTRSDFMQLLIQLKNQGEVGDDNAMNTLDVYTKKTENCTLTTHELAAQAFIFYFAGLETSAITLSYTLYLLAQNPHVQKKLQHEIDDVLAKHNEEITYASISEMEYADMVLSESLRIYPALPILNRICTEKYRMPNSDLEIQEGVQVIIPMGCLHHDPNYYPEPLKFIPDRFSKQNKAKIPPYTYMPFGEGPRICIGMRLARMQSKAGIVTILRKYDVSTCEKTRVPLEWNPRGMLMTPKEEIILRMTKR